MLVSAPRLFSQAPGSLAFEMDAARVYRQHEGHGPERPGQREQFPQRQFLDHQRHIFGVFKNRSTVIELFRGQDRPVG